MKTRSGSAAIAARMRNSPGVHSTGAPPTDTSCRSGIDPERAHRQRLVPAAAGVGQRRRRRAPRSRGCGAGAYAPGPSAHAGCTAWSCSRRRRGRGRAADRPRWCGPSASAPAPPGPRRAGPVPRRDRRPGASSHRERAGRAPGAAPRSSAAAVPDDRDRVPLVFQVTAYEFGLLRVVFGDYHVCAHEVDRRRVRGAVRWASPRGGCLPPAGCCRAGRRGTPRSAVAGRSQRARPLTLTQLCGLPTVGSRPWSSRAALPCRGRCSTRSYAGPGPVAVVDALPVMNPGIFPPQRDAEGSATDRVYGFVGRPSVRRCSSSALRLAAARWFFSQVPTL